MLSLTPGKWFPQLLPVAAALIISSAAAAGEKSTQLPRLFTHQSFVEDALQRTALPIDDVKAVFAYVLGSLPDRVKVYPTENYFYFRFVHNSVQYAGNIRLATETRDDGFVHFAYSIDFAEYKEQDKVHYQTFGPKDGVKVDKLEALVYRISFGDRSVVFELNDLSKVVPPQHAIGPDERYIGPVFDDSALRFFLTYNTKLQLFHYILDETVPVTDSFVRSRETDRILIGKRTGFAFYRDHRLNRKILIGVFEGNARVNNYFDGPFDQLPDNFIQGDSLRSAIIESVPELKGKIDRFGAEPNGESRFMISPYMYYREVDELTLFHDCADNKNLAPDLYYACFLFDPDYMAQVEEQESRAETAKSKPAPNPPQKKKAGTQKKRPG
jgi:hypothetical protein